MGLLALVLGGCTASSGGSPAAESKPALSFSYDPKSFAAPAPSVTQPAPPPQRMAVRESVTLDTRQPAGTFEVSVGHSIAINHPLHNPNFWLAVPVTLTYVDGAPTFDASYIGLGGVRESAADDGSTDSDALGKTINRAACQGLPMLADVLRARGSRRSDGGYGPFRIPQNPRPVRGCVTFTYDRPDHPVFVGYYNDDYSFGHPKLLTSWRLKLPRKMVRSAPPPPPKVTYEITGNGSTALITYYEGNSIEQAAGAAVPWQKKVPANASYFSVSAQDNDGTVISCKIIGADGRVLSRHTATGLYAIVDCSS